MPPGGEDFGPVLRALAADPSTEFGAAGAHVDVLRTIVGRYSSVQRVRIQTPTRTTHAYLKILKPRGPGEEELARADRMLRREYEATAALHKALRQDAGLGALRPIAFLPDLRAIATEEVPGRPWAEIIAARSAVVDEQVAVARRVGRWVRIYQGLSDTPGRIEIAERRAYLDDRLKLLEDRVISPGERQGVLERFDRLAGEIGTDSVRRVPIHADLTPANIVVDNEGRVTVLDFTMAKAGTEYLDLTHVYFHLELMRLRHRSRNEMFVSLQRALLAGYDPVLSSDDPLFRMMLMQHAVCHIALLAERRVPVLDVAYRWFVRRRWIVCDRMASATAGRQVT